MLTPTTAVFAATDPATGAELWRTDGTPGGTTLVVDAVPGATGSLPAGWFRYFAVTGGVAYYRGTDGVNGLELWRSDGTAGGTRMVADLVPGVGDGVFGSPWPAAALGLVFFQGQAATGGYEPFVTDGTAPGTRRLADINPGGDSLPESVGYEFHGWNGQVFLVGRGLFTTDGVTTSLVADFVPGPAPGYPLYLGAAGAVAILAVWAPGGTGTRLVRGY